MDPPVESRTVFDGSIVRLRINDYVRPSGLRVRREVLLHHGAVVMVPVEGDHVLMVRQPREAVQEHLLELPAGKLDFAKARTRWRPPGASWRRRWDARPVAGRTWVASTRPRR
ncbi:MAG: hypothetical protein U0Y82_08495 [Thermoleophilia bacterium]